MKTRVSLLSMIFGAPMFLAAPALMTGACGSSGGSGTTGAAGTGGGNTNDPMNLVSDFEDASAATVVAVNGRNGYWYTYNDNSPAGTDATCMQTPGNGAAYVGSAPPSPSPGGSPTTALHAQWSGCMVWGAGIGADLGQPPQDGGTYSGPKVPYDLTGYTGITFWAMSSTTGDVNLRVKLPMTDETKTGDGGNCVDSATNKCSDDWGQTFKMPNTGAWTQVKVVFSDSAHFKQEGWGATFPWNPAHVTSIQIQSSDKTEAYDFWIDDVYLTK
jgi:hypothetical protein